MLWQSHTHIHNRFLGNIIEISALLLALELACRLLHLLSLFCLHVVREWADAAEHVKEVRCVVD